MPLLKHPECYANDHIKILFYSQYIKLVKETRSQRNFYVEDFKIQVRYALNRSILNFRLRIISVKVKSDVTHYNLDQTKSHVILKT